MIEGTLLHATALRLFAADTKMYVHRVQELATALAEDDEMTAMLLFLFVHFVSESALAALKRASP